MAGRRTSMKGKSILYAEDEFTNRKIMEIQCRKFGVECALEEDGRKALERCSQEHFDLVILDQYMPGLNGDEIARELKKNHPDLPLVAITSDDSCVPRLKATGFDSVYVKPLRGDDYKELLETYLI
jgi:two-component system response regulator ResD